MQRLLDVLPDWLDKWRLSVNVGKTAALMTSKRRLLPPLQLRGQIVEWTNTAKYLGRQIDRLRSTVAIAAYAISNAGAASAMQTGPEI